MVYEPVQLSQEGLYNKRITEIKNEWKSVSSYIAEYCKSLAYATYWAEHADTTEGKKNATYYQGLFDLSYGTKAYPPFDHWILKFLDKLQSLFPSLEGYANYGTAGYSPQAFYNKLNTDLGSIPFFKGMFDAAIKATYAVDDATVKKVLSRKQLLKEINDITVTLNTIRATATENKRKGASWQNEYAGTILSGQEGKMATYENRPIPVIELYFKEQEQKKVDLQRKIDALGLANETYNAVLASFDSKFGADARSAAFKAIQELLSSSKALSLKELEDNSKKSAEALKKSADNNVNNNTTKTNDTASTSDIGNLLVKALTDVLSSEIKKQQAVIKAVDAPEVKKQAQAAAKRTPPPKPAPQIKARTNPPRPAPPPKPRRR